MNVINLHDRFRAETCTFEMAKQAALAGMTPTNTFFAYDEKGEINDAGWMHDMGYKLYPCINFAFAAGMLENTSLDLTKISFYQQPDGLYIFETGSGQKYSSQNIVDCLVSVWLDHKQFAPSPAEEEKTYNIVLKGLSKAEFEILYAMGAGTIASATEDSQEGMISLMRKAFFECRRQSNPEMDAVISDALKALDVTTQGEVYEKVKGMMSDYANELQDNFDKIRNKDQQDE